MNKNSEPDRLLRVVIKQEFVELFDGDVYKAVILNQMLYWSERVKDASKFIQEETNKEEHNDLKYGWIYKSARELTSEIFGICAENTTSKKLAELVEAGFLDSRRNPNHKYDRTLQYRINLTFLQDKLSEIGRPLDGYTLNKNASLPDKNGTALNQNGNHESGEAIPETTTENTTEINTGNDEKTFLDPIAHAMSYNSKTKEAQPFDYMFVSGNALKAYADVFGRQPNPGERTAIVELVDKQSEDFDLAKWQLACQETNLKSTQSYKTVSRIIEVYHAGGTYEAYLSTLNEQDKQPSKVYL